MQVQGLAGRGHRDQSFFLHVPTNTSDMLDISVGGTTLWIREEGCANCNCDAAKAGWGNGVQMGVWGVPGWGKRRLERGAGGFAAAGMG